MDLETASATDFGCVPRYDAYVAEIAQGLQYMFDASIEKHAFFDLAASSRPALQLWAEQEFLTSAMFSQVLSKWTSTIDNYHVRALVMPVLVGEHNGVSSKGLADNAHPNLAQQLCISLGTDLGKLRPLSATVRFIREIEECAANPMLGAGCLGVGNERLLLSEYGAARKAFQACLPDSPFAAFLDANIDEDTWHSALIERAAVGLVSLGFNPSLFRDGARRGVNSRLRYYDDLLSLCRDTDLLRPAGAGQTS